jgi:hypothetical protein
MANTPEHDKAVAKSAASLAGAGIREHALGFEHAPSGDLSEADECAMFGSLDDPIFHRTIEQIRSDLLEAREDIKAGRVYSLEDVLAAMDLAYDQGVRRRLSENGDSVD